jgi:hypothetical protein
MFTVTNVLGEKMEFICLCGYEMRWVSTFERRATFQCCHCQKSFWIPIVYR